MLAALEKAAEAFNKASHSPLAQSWDLRARLLLREPRVWEEEKPAPRQRAAGSVGTSACCDLRGLSSAGLDSMWAAGSGDFLS